MFGRFIKNIFSRKERKYIKDYLFDIELLESILGFKVKNAEYYIKALTHRSYLELFPELEKSNERLEFLGDAVLNMVVAEYLFRTYSTQEEGFLTKVRSTIVNRANLFACAEYLGIVRLLLYNQKYIDQTAEGMKTILSDAIEALIGAIYLDRGLKYAKQFILRAVILPSKEHGNILKDQNYKGQLLELTHSKKISSPRYVVVSETGPQHDKEFVVDVFVNNEKLGSGKGKNKKTAEQNAAKDALSKIKDAPSSS
ncbi:ribonuclease III [Melioribacter roseus P3M-2]|uniref:Ribonuclease 3 n=1 Tax=Melioribacter roseus (strain DSM 23840 / JCM 17771 / VKM B-2668 / P3M-2) TaxID=1191523 RepID=I6YYN3_MELRP|nr:ribonuclease III [Melioribacter roseus]AFN75687.1 ribonuclease III [Melioribacter roseus P3M-2]